MNGYIYKITNIINNKIYIGCTNNPERRWKQHLAGAKGNEKKRLYDAMRQDGIENFTFEIIEECPISEMYDREDFLIKKYNCLDKSVGYNAVAQLSIMLADIGTEESLKAPINFEYEKDFKYISTYTKQLEFLDGDFYNDNYAKENTPVDHIDDNGIEWKFISALGGKYSKFDKHLLSSNMQVKQAKTGRILKNPPLVKGERPDLLTIFAMLYDPVNYNKLLKQFCGYNYNEPRGLVYTSKFSSFFDEKEIAKELKEGTIIKGNNVYYSTYHKPKELSQLVSGELGSRVDQGLGLVDSHSGLLGFDFNRVALMFLLIKEGKDPDNANHKVFLAIQDFIKKLKDEMQEELLECGLTTDINFMDNIKNSFEI